jgi:hypothetical protein
MARDKGGRGGRPAGKHREPAPEERPPYSPQDAMRGADRTPDDLSVRAKSTGHGKKTADKWNQ